MCFHSRDLFLLLSWRLRRWCLVFVALAFWGPDIALMAGLGAVLGHLFPVWLRFRGGKGVATTLGVVLALQLAVGAAACLAWLATAIAFRFSSLAALVATASAPLFAWWIARDLQLVEMTAVLAALVWSRHLANIRRLIKGEEPRIGRSKKD